MAQATLDVTPTTEAGPDSPLFRHTKRPQWGVGILVRQRASARSYQFEDGRLRTIRKGYYTLLEPADDLGDREEVIRENLLRVATTRDDEQRTVLEPTCRFAEQVDLFVGLYPLGFQDPAWIEEHRESEGRTLKRHRTSISKEAQDALSASRCQEAATAGEHQELADAIADILARTDLVPVSHAKALRGLDAEETRAYVDAAVRLLHGEQRYQDRFRQWVATLMRLFGERPSWRVATALPGLVHPATHTVVRHSAFIRQAASIAPTARYSKRAKVGSYRNFLRVAQGVRTRLSEAGHEPRDLLDVYDFIWTTLRKSALEHLGAD